MSHCLVRYLGDNDWWNSSRDGDWGAHFGRPTLAGQRAGFQGLPSLWLEILLEAVWFWKNVGSPFWAETLSVGDEFHQSGGLPRLGISVVDLEAWDNLRRVCTSSTERLLWNTCYETLFQHPPLLGNFSTILLEKLGLSRLVFLPNFVWWIFSWLWCPMMPRWWVAYWGLWVLDCRGRLILGAWGCLIY